MAGDIVSPGESFLAGNQTVAQVGIDGHLATGHAIEGKPCGHFADARGPSGNHQELDGDKDDEDNQTNRGRAGRHKVAECVNQAAGGVGAVIRRPGQNQPRRSDVQDQPGERRAEQNGREGTEFERVSDGDRGQQDDDSQRDIGGQQQVKEDRRQRNDQHQDGADDQQRENQIQALRDRVAQPGSGPEGHPCLRRWKPLGNSEYERKRC